MCSCISQHDRKWKRYLFSPHVFLFSLCSPSEPSFSSMCTGCCFLSSGPLLSSVLPSCSVLHPPPSMSVSQTASGEPLWVSTFQASSYLPSQNARDHSVLLNPQFFFLSMTLHFPGFLLRSFMGSEAWAQPWVSSWMFYTLSLGELTSPWLSYHPWAKDYQTLIPNHFFLFDASEASQAQNGQTLTLIIPTAHLPSLQIFHPDTQKHKSHPSLPRGVHQIHHHVLINSIPKLFHNFLYVSSFHCFHSSSSHPHPFPGSLQYLRIVLFTSLLHY